MYFLFTVRFQENKLYFFCLFIFIGHYWLLLVKPITDICVYLKITSSASLQQPHLWVISYDSWFLSLVLDLALYYAPTLNA